MPTTNKLNEGVLTSLGISDKEAKFYLALLQLGPSTILPVARLAGLKRTSVYNFVDELVRTGLVTFYEKNGRRYYRAENPEVALRILDECRQKLNAFLPALIDMYKNGSQAPEMRTFYGPEGIKQALLSSLECQSKKIYSIIDVDSADAGIIDIKFWEEYINEATRQQIVIHSLRHRDEKIRLPDYRYLHLGEVRKTLLVYKYLPQKIRLSNTVLVYDDMVVIASPSRENWAIVVKSQSFAATMISIHNLLWQISR